MQKIFALLVVKGKLQVVIFTFFPVLFTIYSIVLSFFTLFLLFFPLKHGLYDDKYLSLLFTALSA